MKNTEDMDRWVMWQRNVKDHMKNMSNEEIKSQLQATANPFSILVMNILGDFNFSSVIRSANSFGAKTIYYYGQKRFDARGACGAKHYSDVQYLSDFQDIVKLKENHHFIALENNVPGTIPLPKFSWKTDKDNLIVVGCEGKGLDNDMISLCDNTVEIPSFGSIRSLNLAAAASIAMYDFISKMKG